MRIRNFLILGIFCFGFVFAADINLKSVTKDGKTSYLLQAAAFPRESNALQLKFKLSSQFKHRVSIEYDKEKKLYLVLIGPFRKIQEAETIQQELNLNNYTLQTFAKRAPSFRSQLATDAQEPPQQQEPLADEETKPATPSLKAPEAFVSEPSASNNNGRAFDSGKKLWNLRNADIRAVIGEVSRVTGKNFVIDPRVQGKISIVAGSPISDKELYQVFLSMLQVSGYAAIPFGDVIKIVPNIDAKTISTYVTDPLQRQPRGDEMLVEVVPVRYVPAEQLVPALRPLMPQWSSISAYEPSNMIILSGRANNIKRLASIIRQVDASTANGIDVVKLHHALAMDIGATLKDIIKATTAPGGRSQVTIAPDDRSNTILVSGSRTERIRLRMLIEKLDRSSPNGSNSSTQVVYLHYLRAEDLVPILAGVAQANFSGIVGTTIGTITRPALDSTNPASSLVAGTMGSPPQTMQNNSGTGSNTTTTTPTGATSNPEATPGTSATATKNEGSTKPSVQIIAEPNTNAIILNAPPSLIRILRNVIVRLDIQPAQIMIEALVVEVNESDISDLGIEWGTQYTDGIRTDGTFQNGFAIIDRQLSINDFQARIHLLVEENKANILSTPSVMVLDNRQAKILVGKQVSVGASTYPNNAVGTALGSPYTTFSRVNVALHLYVRPQITKGQGIQMQIDQGNDTIDPLSELDTTNPIFRISSIVTSVQVESGDLVVLGGLTQDTLANDENGLGIISGIPGLGRLFQRKLRNREKRVLLVVIRPVILHNECETINLSGGKYNDLRNYQLEWLRSQQFDPTNDDTLLPPLKQARLPRPFLPPPAPVAEPVLPPMPAPVQVTAIPHGPLPAPLAEPVVDPGPEPMHATGPVSTEAVILPRPGIESTEAVILPRPESQATEAVILPRPGIEPAPPPVPVPVPVPDPLPSSIELLEK